MLTIETFPVGPLQCNCSIVACTETREALVIDPGGDAPQILKYLQQHNLQAKYLLHTHAHFDHVGATAEVKAATGASILLHPGDQWLYDNISLQGRIFGIQTADPTPVDLELQDEMPLIFGKEQSLVLHTPGHTPGSCCFHLSGEQSYLFSGDTLFKGSIGRSDLWGGDHETLLRSIKQRLLRLDESTTVYTGHGPQTTLWHEKKHNPFLC
jgi:hydroxyacylglutathione hydrolase